MLKRYCIVVAGGRGIRMGEEIPKQFLLLNGKPVLIRTLSAIKEFDSKIIIVLALPANQIGTWEKLCNQHSFSHKIQVVHGGKTRFHSVKNALDTIPNEGLVAVHDGVRPLITKDLFERCYNAAEIEGNAIPIISVSESMREITPVGNHQVDRSKYVLIQTPQVFQTPVLKEAFCLPYEESFTDEASMLEKMGMPIKLVSGETNNIKITTKTDLLLAEAIISRPKN